MKIKIINDNTIKLSGDLNIYVVSDLKERIQGFLSKKPVVLRVDLTGVTDMDTSCVQLLLSLKIYAKRNKIDYKLINPGEIVKEAFWLSGIMKKTT